MNSSLALLYVLNAVTEIIACFCFHCHFFISLTFSLPYNHQKSNFLSKTYEPIVSQFWYPLSRCVSPGCFPAALCLHYVSFMERQLIVCENDTTCRAIFTRPTHPKAVPRRKLKLIMSVTGACSKGITGKELMSFFSYFQALAVRDQWYIDIAKQIPI